MELGFANGMVDDIFSVPGYDLKGSVVAQVIPLFLCFFFFFDLQTLLLSSAFISKILMMIFIGISDWFGSVLAHHALVDYPQFLVLDKNYLFPFVGKSNPGCSYIFAFR